MQPLRDITNQLCNQIDQPVVQLPNGKRRREFVAQPPTKRANILIFKVHKTPKKLLPDPFSRNLEFYKNEDDLVNRLYDLFQQEGLLSHKKILNTNLENHFLKIIQRSVKCNFAIQTIECALQFFLKVAFETSNLSEKAAH